jgi:hypothetical protein
MGPHRALARGGYYLPRRFFELGSGSAAAVWCSAVATAEASRVCHAASAVTSLSRAISVSARRRRIVSVELPPVSTTTYRAICSDGGLRGGAALTRGSITPRSPIRMRHRPFDRYTDAADGSRCTESSLAQGISVYSRTTTAAAELNRGQPRGHELVDAEVLEHQLKRDLPFDLPGDGEENGDDGPGGEPGHDGPPEPDAPDA